MQPLFETVAIVGPGLIGGSLGMAIRQRRLAGRVIGIGHRQVSLQEALKAGAADSVTLEAAEGVREADLVVLATPISALARLMPAIAASVKTQAVVTDVASTKQEVIATVTGALRTRPDVAYVPAHPMTGSERRGVANAHALLFERSVCILTPLPGTSAVAVRRVRELWEGVGARVCQMDPASHDHLVARISHLPHLAAVALLQTTSADEAALAGPGLTDTTRIASGDPALWRDICETNAPHITLALDAYLKVLEHLRDLVASRQFDRLQELLCEAKARRDGLITARGGEMPRRA